VYCLKPVEGGKILGIQQPHFSALMRNAPFPSNVSWASLRRPPFRKGRGTRFFSVRRSTEILRWESLASERLRCLRMTIDKTSRGLNGAPREKWARRQMARLSAGCHAIRIARQCRCHDEGCSAVEQCVKDGI
jgi:hypothetical protein